MAEKVSETRAPSTYRWFPLPTAGWSAAIKAALTGAGRSDVAKSGATAAVQERRPGDLRGLNAVVTGASRGIGPHIARRLAQEGMNLVLVARSGTELEEVARELRQQGARVSTVIGDLSHRAGRADILARVADAVPHVDVLVNNAGVYNGGRLDQRPVEDVARTFETNAIAPLELTRELLPGMKDRKFGHVVHIASLAGKMPVEEAVLYTATKYAVIGANQALQREVKGTGVHSSAICPGYVGAEGIYARAQSASDLKDHFALGHTTPQKVADAVVSVLKNPKIERIVNPMPARPVALLWSVAPRLAAGIYEALGVSRFMEDAGRVAVKDGGLPPPDSNSTAA